MNWIQAWQTGNWSTDDLLQVCESIIYTTRTLQRSIDGLVVNYFSDNCNVSLVQLAASFPSHTYTCGCWHMASLSISPCLFTWAFSQLQNDETGKNPPHKNFTSRDVCKMTGVKPFIKQTFPPAALAV